MYGSYPEISISTRYIHAQLERIPIFSTKPKEKNWPISSEKIFELLKNIVRHSSQYRKKNIFVESTIYQVLNFTKKNIFIKEKSIK